MCYVIRMLAANRKYRYWRRSAVASSASLWMTHVDLASTFATREETVSVVEEILDRQPVNCVELLVIEVKQPKPFDAKAVFGNRL